MRKSAFLLFSVISLLSCSSSKKTIQKETKAVLLNPFFENQFTGFLVIDAEKKILYIVKILPNISLLQVTPKSLHYLRLLPCYQIAFQP